MRKYEFTGEVKVLFGKTLKQIKASLSFGNVTEGEIGGWIEKEENLNPDPQVSGDAWVYGNAQVYGDAQVYGNAWVYGNARVYGDAQVYGNARVSGNAWVLSECSKTPICIFGLDWGVTIIDAHISIGCQFHSIAEWRGFDDEKISSMDSKALPFWKKYKDVIFSLIDNRGE